MKNIHDIGESVKGSRNKAIHDELEKDKKLFAKNPTKLITLKEKQMKEAVKTLEGKYLIVAARHIIRFDRHETLIEIASDSTNRQLVGDTTGSLRVASN
jgi:hypothetical protein